MGRVPSQSHRFSLFFPEVQQFLKHKHFLDCCMPLMNFQIAEIVHFLCQFCPASQLFLWGKDMTFSPPSITATRCPPVLIYFKLKHTYIGRLSQKKYQREMGKETVERERTDSTPSAASACSKSLQYSVKKIQKTILVISIHQPFP